MFESFRSEKNKCEFWRGWIPIQNKASSNENTVEKEKRALEAEYLQGLKHGRGHLRNDLWRLDGLSGLVQGHRKKSNLI